MLGHGERQMGAPCTSLCISCNSKTILKNKTSSKKDLSLAIHNLDTSPVHLNGKLFRILQKAHTSGIMAKDELCN